jgi:hypothetical protein
VPLSILQMVQQAEMELGLPAATTVYTSGATNTDTQMGALANRVLDEMRQMRPDTWTAMQSEFNLIVNPPTNTTGNLGINSAVITNIPSTAGLSPNFWQVAGPGIPVASRIKSVDSPTQVTMTMENSNPDAITGAEIQFMQDTYAMPPDFDFYTNRTMWDRTNRWELLGPDSPQLDQWHRSGIVATGPRRHFRQIGAFANQFRIWPAPAEITEPLQLVFEYSSIYAVAVNGVVSDTNPVSSFAQYFANDADTCLLNAQAIIMGIKWMFWEVKGFGSYVTLQNRWIDYVKRLIARDGASPTLPMVNRTNPIFVSSASVQDGFFPGPVGPNQGV